MKQLLISLIITTSGLIAKANTCPENIWEILVERTGWTRQNLETAAQSGRFNNGIRMFVGDKVMTVFIYQDGKVACYR